MTLFTAWKELNHRHVRVLDISGVIDDFGYPTSARLPRPRIKVLYLDSTFSSEETLIPNNTLFFDGLPLTYDGQYVVYEA